MTTTKSTFSSNAAAVFLISWFLIIVSPAFSQLGHVQTSNWFEITKTPTEGIVFSVNEIEESLYIIGGQLFPPNPKIGISDVWIYNIEADEWSTGTDMPTARPLVPKLNIGEKIYAIGGHRNDTLTWNRVEVYDVSTDEWTRVADMPTSRRFPTACVYDEKIYVFGGLSPITVEDDTKIESLDIVERYDPATDTWDTCAPMITGRCASSACVLNDSIYVIGGSEEEAGGWLSLTTVEVYDPVTDEWATKRNMINARGDVTNAVSNGKLYAIGGYPTLHGRILHTAFEVYDPRTNIWTLCDDPEDLHPRGGAANQAINVKDRVYILNAIGPYADLHPVYQEVYVYNQPVIKVKSNPVRATNDTLLSRILEACTLYIVPPGTPAKIDSILQDSIISYDAHTIQEHRFDLGGLPPGNYLFYAVTLDGRVDLNYYTFRIIDHFPEYIIQVQDADTKEPLDSCFLEVNGQDTIPGIQGEFDLTGYYDTCSIALTREGYFSFDTTLIVLTDNSIVIYLDPMPTGTEESVYQEFRIYPNPSHDLITVQTEMQGECSLQIINMSGHIMRKSDLAGTSFQVDLSTYKCGVYLIRIESRNQVFMGRVIKY